MPVAIHAASSKATPDDADELGITDSAAAWVLKKLTWANLKAALKVFFDALYQPLSTVLSLLAGLTPATNKIPYFTGTSTVGLLDFDTDGALTANSDTRIASQKAVKTAIASAVASLLKFQTATDCSGNPNYPAALKGYAYVVSVAGKIGGASGAAVDAGDVYFAIADNAGGTQAAVGASWVILEHNLAGALLAANNLSDLTNAGTARTNLGLAIGTNVQAWNAILDAFVALSPSDDDFLQRKSGAWVNRTIAQVLTDLQGTGSSASAAGFRGLPTVSSSSNRTCVLSDVGKRILHPSGAGAGDTFTIDSHVTVAWPDGGAITFDNRDSNSLSIACTTDTLVLAGTTTTGTRTLSQNGVATFVFDSATNTWSGSGPGLG